MSRSRSSSLTSVPQAEQNLSSNKSETLVKSLLIFCELKELVKKILEAKKNAPKNKTAIEDLISQGQLLFVDLKELNRELLTDVEADKDKLNKHKEQLNQLHLRLQNFQYEKNHLLREIESCKNYRPKQQIDGLVSEEEFLHSATPDQLPQDKGDEHQVMLKRLAFELDQRRKLSDQIAEMTTRKKALIDMNESRANYLKGLQSKLKAIDTASKQLDPHITLSIKQRFKNADQAQFLPGPLYILFSHLNAYKESYDLDVEISVEGNIEDARAEYGKVVEKKKPVNEDEAYTSHPLFVQLSFSKVNARTLNPPVTIKFEYLTYLNIVAVSVTTTNAALSDKDFLIDLFPQDSGENTPNMANLYLFGGKPFSFDPSKKGRPFWWAQWLSGLQFLRNRPEISQNNEAMQVDQVNPLDNNYHFKITEVFDRIKKRVLARLTLSQQLEQLC
jgi:THO complex subunit 5